MRITLLTITALLLAIALTSLPAQALPGMGPGAGGGSGWHHDDNMPGPYGGGAGMGPGQGQDQGWMDHSNILNGEPFQHSGQVAELDYHAGGMVMATDQGNVQLHGLGPAWYWQSHDMDWPGVGDALNFQGFMVDYNGTPVNIVMSVILANGRALQLRDPETGWPLWMN